MLPYLKSLNTEGIWKSGERGIGRGLTHSCNLYFKDHFKCIIPDLLSSRFYFVTQLPMIRPSNGWLWLAYSVFYSPPFLVVV